MKKQSLRITRARIFPVVVVALMAGHCSAAVTALSPELVQAFEKAGWDARRAGSGDLILRRVPVPEEAEAASASVEPSQQDMFQRLRDKGWRVETASDGSTLLYPPQGAEPSSETVTVQTAPAVKPAEKTLDELLEERNWRVTRSADGSMTLYPKSAKSTTPSAVKTALPVCAGWLPSADAGLVGVELPVDVWAEAKALAQAWIDRVGDAGLAVGRIRKVRRVYVVSIVGSSAPFRLKHQIALNSADGRVMVLN